MGTLVYSSESGLSGELLVKMPFGLGAANQRRSTLMFTKTEPASWRENAPNRGLVCGVLAMTALMSVTAVSALFILPHMGGEHSVDTPEQTRQADAAPAKEKITTITAEPTGRKGRVAAASRSVLVSEAAAAEASDMPLAADPRWAQVVAAGATKSLEAMPAIPGAEKVIAKDPDETAPLALAGDARSEVLSPDPAETAAVAPAKATDEPAGREVKIKRSANLRAKPQKGGKVLGVIPAKSAVELVSCTQWCEVVFNGKRGYVYKSYIK